MKDPLEYKDLRGNQEPFYDKEPVIERMTKTIREAKEIQEKLDLREKLEPWLSLWEEFIGEQNQHKVCGFMEWVADKVALKNK